MPTSKTHDITYRVKEAKGYCAIGIEHGKCPANLGTLFRSADLFDAAFIFTVGHRYKRQPTDTLHSWRHLPLFNFPTLDDLYLHMPYDCLLVGVELMPEAAPIAKYVHPPRAVYLLGAEDWGISSEARSRVQQVVQLPGRRSLNVAVAGSLVLFHRHLQLQGELR
jgi:tRNA G18 (ribose-2'-O)-methylase SpoU